MIVLLLLLVGLAASQPTLNNVVVFIMDDLSPFYLDPNHPLKMPNLKKLATRGVEFTNAHTAFPVCGPSRMALMSGRFADSTRLFTFERFIPQVHGLTTVSRYLGDNFEIDTVGFGKIFHEDKNGAKNVISQSLYQDGHWTQGFRYGGSADDECPTNQLYCTFKNEKKTGDFMLASKVISFFSDRITSKKKDKPVVAFVGLRKPHLELGMPIAFANKPQHGEDVIQQSEPNSIAADGAEIPFRQSLSRYECYDELQARRIGKSTVLPLDKLSNQTSRLTKIRQMYFAASNWVDSNMGRIIDYIENTRHYSNNTAFVIVSDHGFSNGEHGLYCKNTLFDQSTRVPLVVVPARRSTEEIVDDGVIGTQKHNPVGTIDMFPTIVHLATGTELPLNAAVDTTGYALPGRSVLAERGLDKTVYTFSQYPRCELVSSAKGWSCVTSRKNCDRIPNTFMGYMVRTEQEKYVEWRAFQDKFTQCAVPSWPGLTNKMKAKLKKVWQIDQEETHALWDQTPVQRELFNDYSTGGDIKWSNWEKENALVHQNKEDMWLALEMSAAIRWRFDSAFTGKGVAEQPCSGHGKVRLVAPELWKGYEFQPTREDVQCECLVGWTGPECAEKQQEQPPSSVTEETNM